MQLHCIKLLNNQVLVQKLSAQNDLAWVPLASHRASPSCDSERNYLIVKQIFTLTPLQD